MIFTLELSGNQKDILLSMPNGDVHVCTEDTCDCAAYTYGRLCRHRQFILAMGGFDELKEVILKERRAVQRRKDRDALATNTNPN